MRSTLSLFNLEKRLRKLLQSLEKQPFQTKSRLILSGTLLDIIYPTLKNENFHEFISILVETLT